MKTKQFVSSTGLLLITIVLVGCLLKFCLPFIQAEDVQRLALIVIIPTIYLPFVICTILSSVSGLICSIISLYSESKAIKIFSIIYILLFISAIIICALCTVKIFN
ncbi:MAG: hypothetical protein ACI4L6_00530 [Candidatus Onthoplasma sp.]